MKNSRPDISLIRKYLKGELDARAMHQLEREAEADPMLMDMLMGMEMSGEEESVHQIADIGRLIEKRVQQEKTVPLFPWKRLIAAASLIFICSITAFLLLRMPQKNDSRAPAELALKKNLPSNTPDTIKPGLLPDEQLVAVNPAKAKKAVVAPQAGPLSAARLNTVTAEAVVADSVVYKGDALAEVVVSGSAIQMKKEIASSSTTIAAPAIEVAPALAGKVAGVQVSAKRSKDKPVQTVSGIIKDEGSGLPIPGATVSLKSENKVVSTDSQGRFALSSSVKRATLEVAVIGYDRQEVKVHDGQELDISLRPTADALSEVVVVASGRQHEVKPLKAEPVIGWKAYDEYLKIYARSADGITGKVTLVFTLDASGTPQEIKVVKGENKVLNDKAIGLIARGSKWQRGNSNTKKEIQIKIRFR